MPGFKTGHSHFKMLSGISDTGMTGICGTNRFLFYATIYVNCWRTMISVWFYVVNRLTATVISFPLRTGLLSVL